MPRRLWLSLALLATGAGLLAATRVAVASPPTSGLLRVGASYPPVSIDPQASWITTAWWLEYATAAKLYNYPDQRGPAGAILRPEVASSFSVSRNGKTYTFRIRKGFRFSDGTAVTSKSFEYAIDRAANHDLASPAAQFITDSNGTNIVGAAAVNEGEARHVRGVIARENRLIIHLTRPDGAFLSKITMPFFQATSRKLPLTHDVGRPYPSAGPYAFTRHDVDRLTSIRRNSYWKRGPGRRRPRNLAGVDILWYLNQQTAFEQVKANQLDEGPLPAAEVKSVADEFGVNRTRFWVEPWNCTGYLPMNMANHIFKNNLPLRRAVNYAINRRAYVAQAGPYAGMPWTHIFNPGVPGWRNVTLYKRNLETARRLAAGHLRDGKITVYYRSHSTINRAQSQIVRQDLINLGFKPEDITMKDDYKEIYDPLGTRGNDADIAVSRGWCSDYPDPYEWINRLFDGNLLKPENNVNWSYMDLPKWNRRMEAAARLVGPRRFRVYGQLDLDLMRRVAPVAVERTYNNQYFFSDRVDPRSLVYQGIYQDWSIPAMEVKR
jgi:ABC-type oligopeptide transport system substrate-binding subunit